MAHTTTVPTRRSRPAAAGGTLAWAAGCRRTADTAEAELLQAACQWADEHPPESISQVATLYADGHGDTGIPIAGPGASLVAEFCIPELAAALGMSTDAGQNLIGEALELRDRLPKLWARVQALELPAWRGRRIGRQTMALSLEAAGWLDTQLAPYAHKSGLAQVDRLVTEALARFQPAEAAKRAAQAAESRHADLHFNTAGQLGPDGTVEFTATLDLLDGYDLDEALRRGANRLQDLGSTDPLGVRRSHALGDLARLQFTLDFENTGSRPEPGASKHLVKLHVHLTDAALQSLHRGGCDLARVEEHHQVLLAETLKAQLANWLDRADLKIHVVPVIDLNQQIAVDSYEIPDRLRERVTLRDHTCVFPWCNRPARTRCDLDHIDPYRTVGDSGPPGQTNDLNLAPLCRRHHRLKTFDGWTYLMLEPGRYLWTSPHGQTYLRDHTGTIPTDR